MRAVITFAVVSVAGLSVGFAYINGLFDGPLSNVGLNYETCAENLFGNKMCGDELADFCEDHYSPRQNGDTCGPVLREQGIDPEAIVEEERARRRAYERCVDREFERENPSVSACEFP